MSDTPGVYLFDEFDALGTVRTAHNDVGEIRRVLNSFLQFMERDDSDSIVIAATNLVEMLDPALFRRFDDVITYSLPTPDMAGQLIANRLSAFNISEIAWPAVTAAARGLSHADISRACDDAAKAAVLEGRRSVTTLLLTQALRARQSLHGVRKPKRKTRKK
jgi:SpoVK/Ycf46/Vps4 family AAA+-type ATPase